MQTFNFSTAYQVSKKIIVLFFGCFALAAKSQKVYFFTFNPESQLVTSYFTNNAKPFKNILVITKQTNYYYSRTPTIKGLIGTSTCITPIIMSYKNTYGSIKKRYTDKKENSLPNLKEEEQLNNKIEYELSISNTFKCICNYFSNVIENENTIRVLNDCSTDNNHSIFGTTPRIAYRVKATNMFYADSSYYYYSNPKKMIQHFNIGSDDYLLDSLERFTMLNFNAIHYEWKYASNGLPEAILKVPITLFDSTTWTSDDPEAIYFKYNGSLVTTLKHYHLIAMYGRMVDIFTKGYKNVSYLKELLLKKNVLESKSFFTDVLQTDILGSKIDIFGGGFLAHFTYKGNSAMKAMLFEDGLNTFKGKYYYDKSGLVKKILYKNMYYDNVHGTSILENKFYYTIAKDVEKIYY